MTVDATFVSDGGGLCVAHGGNPVHVNRTLEQMLSGNPGAYFLLASSSYFLMFPTSDFPLSTSYLSLPALAAVGTSGITLGRSFAHAALQGGGYVTYNWAVSTSCRLSTFPPFSPLFNRLLSLSEPSSVQVTVNDPASEKISFVIGVRRFGVSYYVGVGFDHVIKPQVSTS